MSKKVYYRPIEAAIRWSGLERFEARIIEQLGTRKYPAGDEFPRWPSLRLNSERIVDALRNGELPHCKAGVRRNGPADLEAPDLMVRHVDLRAWMRRYYPDQRPPFLFDRLERQLHPAINVATVQSLLAEREALRIALTKSQADVETLRKSAKHGATSEASVARRSETTYINILGGLLTLILGKSPSGMPYSSFRTMEAVISALIAHHEGLPGMSERTLWSKLAAAKKQVGMG